MSDTAIDDDLLFDSFDGAEFVESVSGFSRLVVAFSGGVDSSVLLHLVQRVLATRIAAQSVAVSALHVNHQLHANSVDWAAHCQRYCDDLAIPLTIETVNVCADEGNLESRARQARYRVFEQQVDCDTVLVTAHHADDQAETLIFRLLRGAGIHGATAMPKARKLGAGTLYRPLLRCRREQLIAYAHKHDLRYLNDPSNDNLQFDRNYLRHRVMPNLSARWHQAVANLNRFSEHAAEAAELLDQLARDDIVAAFVGQDAYGVSLDIDAINTLSDLRKKNALRYWLRQHCGVALSRVDTRALLLLFEQAQSGKQLIISGKAVDSRLDDDQERLNSMRFTLAVFQRRVYIFRAVSPLNESLAVNIDLSAASFAEQNTVWAGLVNVELRLTSASGCLGLRADHYRIGVRRTGDKMLLRGVNRRVKDLMQELSIPPWLRDSYPIFYCNGEVAAIGDLAIADKFAAESTDHEPCYQISLVWL